MPFLRLAIGSTAAVDEARHIAFIPGINDETGAELHHVEVGLACLLGQLHAPLTLPVCHHFTCTTPALKLGMSRYTTTVTKMTSFTLSSI